MKCHVVSTLVCLVSGLSFAAKPSAPAAHLIENVPWHQQINGLFCGDGGTVVYPPYVYTDEIGGVGLIRW
jgi:hypothetical protein